MTKRRYLVGVLATLAIVGPLAYLWQQSRMPGTYNVMDMGYVDHGGGPTTGGHHAADVSVDDLRVQDDREGDVTFVLTAREERFELASGRSVNGFTVNGTSPGPTITARVGELVEVTLRNENVPAGVTIHWHGIDVPNSQDGVAGITQDAVRTGEEHVYRFVAEQVGTYWYHSHQVSHRQVVRGLLGAVIVLPAEPDDRLDVTALAHTYGGVRTINGEEGAVTVPATSGQVTRVRVINTDNGRIPVWSGSPYKVLAVDGYDVNEPTTVNGKLYAVPAGGRVDLEVVAPARVQIGGSTALVVGEDSEPVRQPRDTVDLLSYGSPAELPFEAGATDRDFDYRIGRRPGFVDGVPGFWWSINGHLWPDIPMFTVEEGDVVRFRIKNSSGEIHPMHLHGHHAVVLSRNGEEATGSPWWVDSLDVEDGEEYEIAFLADNPGLWADHCHNLNHAAEGLIAHLMYAGVTTPYELGDDSGNEPD
ncbi:MAG TPA: multicopper oxidase family protein [Nocardioidaceae bacterium]|nr:multicopper oxidase family protein [Nocardioidaceae bacterium]